MDKCVLDTDIFSEVLKARDPQVVNRAERYLRNFARYTISVITVVEVVKGFSRLGREDRLEEFARRMANLEVLVFDDPSAVIAGKIYAGLERAGRPIGRADPMVAAIAIRHGMPLVTGNAEHYQRVCDLGFDLKLDSWREG